MPGDGVTWWPLLSVSGRYVVVRLGVVVAVIAWDGSSPLTGVFTLVAGDNVVRSDTLNIGDKP